MSRANIQVPVTASLKQQSVRTALDLGFSSVQDMIRFLLNQLNSKKLEIGAFKPHEENVEYLTEKQADRLLKRLKKAEEELKRGEYYTEEDIQAILTNSKIN